MKNVCRSVLMVVCSVALFTGMATAEKRSITEKDIFQFQWIGNPQMSPDGSQVAFVRIVVGEKQQYETSIWTVATAGGEPRKLTSGKHDAGPRWSPDGKYLAFQRSVEKEGKPEPPQIFILAMAGGEAWPLTEMPQGAGGPTWSPDGKTIAFTSGANPQDLAMAACDKEKDKSKCAKPEHEPDIHVVTRAVFRLNGEGYLDFSRPDHIWTIAFPSNPQDLPKPKQLTSGNFDEGDLVWAPDGSKIYFTSDRNLEPYYEGPANVVYSVSAAGGETAEVARIDGAAFEIALSPDGRKLAFIGQDAKPVQSYKKADLWVMDLGGKPRKLTADYDWDIDGGILGDQEPPRGGAGTRPVWSTDGKSVMLVVAKQGRANIERVDVESGKITPVTSGDQAVESFTSNGTQTVAEISTPVMINDLFAVGDGSQKRLTDVNAKLFGELNIAMPEDISYTSFDGKKIEGWVQKPPDFDPKKKYPLILNIHGGPHTAYGYVFFHEMQWMAAKGYVVLYPNPRGSTSYGEAFGNIIQYHYPGDDFKDLMAGVDELIKRGYVDDKRLGVTGGSGGGLLTNWVVGHTDRFAAAVSQRDISDWAAWWYIADFTLFQENWFRKPPFQDPEDYRLRSPITYINNVKTPLMLILGDTDLRSPASSGGDEMFRALKWRKIPTAEVRFPGESHELSRSGQPWHRVERLHHIVNWFDIYLKGVKSNEYDLVPPVEPEWEKSR